MTHYALIESNSGYFWGSAIAETPIEACKKIDNDVCGRKREYEETTVGSGDAYYVYEVPADFDFGNGDGQSPDLIERICDLDLVAIVKSTIVVE